MVNLQKKLGENLAKKVLQKSESQNLKDAVNEWSLNNMTVDMTMSTYCLCGQPHIKYIYSIKNYKNGNIISPIGSDCIRKFGRKDLDRELKLLELLYKMKHAFTNKERVELNSDYFSRDLLGYLYEKGAFKPSEYNEGNPVNDYNFMVDMFNQRADPNTNQKRKIYVMINKYVKDFVEKDCQEINGGQELR